MKISISKKEVARFQKILHEELSDQQRDEVLAHMIVSLFELQKAVAKIGARIEKDTKATFSRSEWKDIEDSISLGPSWLHYTRKVRRKQKES